MKALTPLRLSVQTALVMLAFTLLFTGLMAGIYALTHEKIAQSKEDEKLRLINEVFPAASYDNDLLKDAIALPDGAELGLKAGGTAWRARQGGKVVGVVMEALAPDGYAGDISLLVGINAAGQISGVRVTAHRETPGLGDYIDPKKDKNKIRPWITQFNGQGLEERALAGWRVKKDGGEIDYMTGATISPRAVSRAVARALTYTQTHHNMLFESAEKGAP